MQKLNKDDVCWKESPDKSLKTPHTELLSKAANYISHACKNSINMFIEIDHDHAEYTVETEESFSIGKLLIHKWYKEERSYVISLN